MPFNFSESSNFQKSAQEAIALTLANLSTDDTAATSIIQRWEVTNVGGDYTEEDSTQSATVTVDLKKGFQALLQSQHQQDLTAKLEQMAKSEAESVGQAAMNVASSRNSVDQHAMALGVVATTISSKCMAATDVNQTVVIDNVKGNVTIRNRNTEASVAVTQECISKAIKQTMQGQSLDVDIKQTATSKAIGFSLSAMMNAIIAIAALVVVIASFVIGRSTYAISSFVKKIAVLLALFLLIFACVMMFIEVPKYEKAWKDNMHRGETYKRYPYSRMIYTSSCQPQVLDVIIGKKNANEAEKECDRNSDCVAYDFESVLIQDNGASAMYKLQSKDVSDYGAIEQKRVESGKERRTGTHKAGDFKTVTRLYSSLDPNADNWRKCPDFMARGPDSSRILFDVSGTYSTSNPCDQAFEDEWRDFMIKGYAVKKCHVHVDLANLRIYVFRKGLNCSEKKHWPMFKPDGFDKNSWKVRFFPPSVNSQPIGEKYKDLSTLHSEESTTILVDVSARNSIKVHTPKGSSPIQITLQKPLIDRQGRLNAGNKQCEFDDESQSSCINVSSIKQEKLSTSDFFESHLWETLRLAAYAVTAVACSCVLINSAYHAYQFVLQKRREREQEDKTIVSQDDGYEKEETVS